MNSMPMGSGPPGEPKTPGEVGTHGNRLSSPEGEPGALREVPRAGAQPALGERPRDNAPRAGENAPRARPNSDERALVAAVLRKDRKATAEFVDRFSDAVYQYVHWRLAPNTDAADDLTQDVFLEAWRNLERYRGESGLKQWMAGIARHKVQDHYRKVLRHAELPDEPDAPPAQLTEGPEFADALVAAQRAEAIQEILAGLPETYRCVLQWRYWDRQSGSEIGKEIGRTEKAVERLLARARSQFREEFARRFGGGDDKIAKGAI